MRNMMNMINENAKEMEKGELTSSNPDTVWRHCAIFDTNVDVVGEL